MLRKNRTKIAYFFLAVALVVGVWALTARNDKNLRKDINRLGTIGCLAGIQQVDKYNDFIDSQIQTQREALALSIKTHDPQRARINRSAIKRYRADKIIPATVAFCNKPILP